MGLKEISYKGSMDVKKAIAYLESITASLKAGTVCIQKGDDFVTLKPSDMIDIETEAEVKADKEKIMIELSWSKKKPAAEQPELKVSSVEPAPKVETVKEPEKKPTAVSASPAPAAK